MLLDSEIVASRITRPSDASYSQLLSLPDDANCKQLAKFSAAHIYMHIYTPGDVHAPHAYEKWSENANMEARGLRGVW